MFSKSVLCILTCVVVCLQTPVKADEPKTVDEVIAKAIEAVGGREKIDAVKSLRMTGKMVMGGGMMEMAMTVEAKRPNKMRMEFTFQGMTGIQAFDGKSGWFVMPFAGKTDPEKMPPEQARLMEQEADLDGPLVDYKKKGHTVELIGKEEADGSDAYKLKVTRKDGDVDYIFLDAEYFLPIKIEGQRKIQGAQIEFELALGDYKEVNGLLVAHSVETRKGPGGANTITFEKVEMNIPLPDERFTMPKVKKEEEAPEDKKAVTDEKKDVKPAEDKD